jgi:rSAM/selenodomain-associated transferase 1
VDTVSAPAILVISASSEHASIGGVVQRPHGVAYVVAKAPRAGVTKTRLCPPLTADQASQLARAFLCDTLASVELAGMSPRIVCQSESEQQALRRLAGPSIQVSVQSGTGLGDALEGAFREGFADAYSAVAVLAADSPTLPVPLITEAFTALDDGMDIALGPADDGGYYLLASRQTHPALFHQMRWSSDAVASETLRRCAALGLRTHVLPAWYDVDTPAALTQLRDDLRRLPMTTAPHTRGALTALEALDTRTAPSGRAA